LFLFGLKKINPCQKGPSLLAGIFFVSVVLEFILSGIVYVYMKPIFHLFNVQNGIINYAIYSAKILLISSTAIGVPFIISIYFLLNKRIKTSIFLFVIRQLLLPVPLTILFYELWYIKGILYAIPMSDALAMLIAILFLRTKAT